ARALLAHVLGTEWLWLSRLRGTPSPVPVWPEWDSGRCAREAGALAGEWERLLGASDEAALAAAVEYTNSKGERWTNAAEDVLLHVRLPGAYHGGQAAASVREGGATPAYTDYIHAVRTGRV